MYIGTNIFVFQDWQSIYIIANIEKINMTKILANVLKQRRIYTIYDEKLREKIIMSTSDAQKKQTKNILIITINK